MDLNVLKHALSVMEPVLLAGTWWAFARSKAYKRLPAFGAYLACRMAVCAPLLLLLYGEHLRLIERHLAYAIYYTSSNTMIFNTLGAKNQGSRLGVYSALVGVATMIGSFVSGYFSFYFGFLATFLLAAVCLAGCALLVPAVSANHPEDALSLD